MPAITPPPGPGTPGGDFVYVQGAAQYALPVANVIEIIEVARLLPFSGALPGCRGSLAHRGHLLPVLDSTTLATGEAGPAAPASTVVVARHDGIAWSRACSPAA